MSKANIQFLSLIQIKYKLVFGFTYFLLFNFYFYDPEMSVCMRFFLRFPEFMIYQRSDLNFPI